MMPSKDMGSAGVSPQPDPAEALECELASQEEWAASLPRMKESETGEAMNAAQGWFSGEHCR